MEAPGPWGWGAVLSGGHFSRFLKNADGAGICTRVRVPASVPLIATRFLCHCHGHPGLSCVPLVALAHALEVAFRPRGTEVGALATEGCLGVPIVALTDAAVGTPSACLWVDEPPLLWVGARSGTVGPHGNQLPNVPAGLASWIER